MVEDLLLEHDNTLLNKPALQFKLLKESFYQGMRNELTLEKLEELSNIAYEIPEPKIFGTYNDDQHFVATLEYFLKCTHETRHRGWFFLKYILPMIKSQSKLLDVGFGSGILTKWIARKFNEITVMDTNHEAIKNFNATHRIIRKKTCLSKINNSILNERLPQNHYDLGVLSHVLYYIERDKWLEVVFRTHETLKPGGLIVIVLNGDAYDKLNLIKHFKGELLPINKFAEKCVNIFGNSNVRLFKSNEAAISKNLMGMLHITGFFLYDVNTTTDRENLVKYINYFLKDEKGNFIINFCQKFIVIHKD